MLNKIFLVLLAAAIVAMGVLTYLPYSWLDSITKPADVQTNYRFYSNISWAFLLISSLILLLFGNLVLWKTRRSWAMWATLLYFVVFVIAQTFWLDRAFFNFQQTADLTRDTISFSPFSGVILVVLSAIIVFFNQYLVKRLHDKMIPATPPVEALPADSLTGEKNV